MTVWDAITERFWNSGGFLPKKKVLSFVAENERTNIRQRQAEGIAAAKAKGVKFGRPSRPYPDNFREIHRDWRRKEITLRQAADACGMPVGTFYEKARKLENSAEPKSGGI